MRTACIIALFSFLAAAQDPMTDALRKGILEEDANHNLNAAIQAYQSVLTQFNADRETAATALFRMAECYRKQGKKDQAAAAYARVIQDFGEQTKLVQQSRRYLPAPPQPPASPALASARKQYRDALQKGIDIANQFLEYNRHQYQLGAISYMDLYGPQQDLAEAQGRMAAFDSGILPQPLAPPPTPEAAKAREQYRGSLAERVRLAQLNYDAANLQYRLGAKQQIDIMESSKKLVEAQLQLAAFDLSAASLQATAKR